jgi:hypothetical protein
MGRARAILADLPVFALFLGVVLALQYHGKAFETEFSGASDEPAHYVSGLLVRDYIAGGLPGSPIEYAEKYYVHYPKVAIGQWPPFFYVVQAAWTLPFSGSRASILILMAMLTAALLLTLYSNLRSEFGWLTGIGMGLLLMSLPLTQRLSREVMSEVLVALLIFAATLSFGRFLDSASWQDAAWFGVWSALALLTKGTGVVLGLLPLLAVLISGKPRLLLRWQFWLPLPIVAATSAPWYLLVPGARHEGVGQGWGVWIDWFKMGETFVWWAAAMGGPLVALAAIGVVERCYRLIVPGEGGRIGGAWAASLALLVSTIISRVTLMAWGFRHTINNLPMLFLFAAAGLWWILRLPPLAKLSMRVKALAAVVLLAIPFSANLTAVSPLTYHGFREIAVDLLAQPSLRGSAFLIASDGEGEGMMVAEIAMREKRPGHIVLRASKVLSKSDWMGEYFQQRFRSAGEMMEYLEGVPVGIVIYDEQTEPLFEHQKLLGQALRSHPDRWQLLGTFPRLRPRGGNRGPIRVYKLVGHEGKPVSKVRIEVLGRTVEK